MFRTLISNSRRSSQLSKKSFSRVDHEKNEGLDQINNDLPENKYPSTQQVQNSDEALNTKVKDSSFVAQPTKVKGSQLKQQTISEVITGSGGSSGIGVNASGRGVSGTNGGILGANNSTPAANKSRSDTRLGKKLDRLATKLNYTPSEQFYVDVDESKPLADSSDADQGYNGTYRNESARSQKIMGAVPGDLMFQRSVDFITKDMLYFVEGQQVFQVASDKYNMNPSVSSFNEDGGSTHNVTYTSGNYLHRNLRFGLDQQGRVTYFVADVDNLTIPGTVDPEIANVSSAHRLIKSNTAELDRQVMDSKAGDEKADIWSPLGRAISEPTKNAYFMSSIEADTGAFVYIAYSKATTNMSFQLNRGPKDGLNEIGPAIEQCVGWRSDEDDSDYVKDSGTYDNNLQNVFDADYYAIGDPALMIDSYDSKAKYHNKADLLLQPRGWRMHLQTADNNMDTLKVPKEFANVYVGQEVFSTIDHEYDPMLPICFTDKASLVTVHNFNEFSGFCKLNLYWKVTHSSTNIESDYKYKQVTLIPANVLSRLGYEAVYIWYKKSAGDGLVFDSTYNIISYDPDSANLTNCTNEIILTFDSTETPTGYTSLGTYDVDDNDTGLVLNVPIVQNPQGQSGTTVVTKSVVENDNNTTFYYYGAGPYSYSYTDLRNNYVIDVKHPLIEGIIQYLENSIGATFYSKLEGNELFIPLVFSTQHMTLAQLIICAATPWINRVRINSMKDVIYYEDNIHEYPFSKLDSIKNVPFHNYVNFNFTGYDSPLESKIMQPSVAIKWIMPEFFWKVDTSKYVLPWYFNENEFYNVADGVINKDASAMSFPSIRSGIRLGALDTLYGMTEKDVRLSLDRLTKQLLMSKYNTLNAIKVYKYGKNTDGQPYVELNSDIFSISDVLSCPRELGLCMDAPSNIFYSYNGSGTASGKIPFALTNEYTPSFVIKTFTNVNTPEHPSILGSTGVNINRGANYIQKWYAIKSYTQTSDTNITGLVFGMNDEGAAEYKPYASLGAGQHYTSGPAIISLQRSLWTRLQMLPFVISPFDGHTTSGCGTRDIYDIAYMFGLCGFRASDYRESVYNREKEVVNQGLLFVEDPWILDSPIVKAGVASSGVTITKGYEIKRN